MARGVDGGIRIQRTYYTDTATQYDAMHAGEGDDNPRNLRWVCAFLRMLGAQSVLDVGAGTGRAIRHLTNSIPGLSLRGVEPVAACIEEAIRGKGIPRGLIIQGVGEALPFPDASFDVSCCFSMLHHVPEPNAVIREMLRVARKGAIIADGNRFAQGTLPLRLIKLALYRAGLWKAANFIRTRGKGYILSEGDGVQYSYSVYDSLHIVEEWSGEIGIIPTVDCKVSSWFHPLLTADGLLVCAVKKGN